MISFFIRHWIRHKALKKGPKFHLGDVVSIENSYGEILDSYVTVVGTKFVHKTNYRTVNTYKYLIDDDWYPEKSLRKIKMVEGFDLAN